ncbi:hypothetical protein GALL_545310 [mine drainage metagenome]|uniref:Uncharacterized protein n=1 Tax=mine drainage metagenome TaxID=410659 RepID=A0A1J5NYS7_9ZZZZ
MPQVGDLLFHLADHVNGNAADPHHADRRRMMHIGLVDEAFQPDQVAALGHAGDAPGAVGQYALEFHIAGLDGVEPVAALAFAEQLLAGGVLHVIDDLMEGVEVFHAQGAEQRNAPHAAVAAVRCAAPGIDHLGMRDAVRDAILALRRVFPQGIERNGGGRRRAGESGVHGVLSLMWRNISEY